jgi:signal transduction histidine kinase
MDLWIAGTLAVKPVLAQIAANWPLAVSLAAAVGAQGLWAGRRRTALNEAMHELRRPLQALALAVPAVGPAEPAPAGIEWSLQMAAVALERLDREINGVAAAADSAPILVRPLLESAVGRWRALATLAGGSLDLEWRGAETVVDGDRCAIAQALDNLIVNAIEHGGPAIVVAARLGEGKLRLSVADSGRGVRPGSRRRGPAEPIARLSGRRRRGHGLRVVRRTAAAHGGEFRLRCSERGSEAVLELPVPAGARERAA